MEEQPSLSTSDINAELLFLLGVPNPNWERIQFLFRLLLDSDFSHVPAPLINKLGTYYVQNMVREQISEDEAVTACLLSHQAYGYSLPPMLANLFQKWSASQPFQHSPFPQPVTWSTPALMQIDPSASMDSPVIHAWVYNDEKNLPIEVIICGRGIGWIREQVDNAVLSTALRLSAKSADVLLEGFTCLRLTTEEIAESAEAKGKQTYIPTDEILTGGKTIAHRSIREDTTPADAMRELVAELTQLEAKTGLVNVIKRPYVLRSEYQQSINTKSREYRSQGVTLWQHSASETNRIIIPYPVSRLNIHLPFSLIESPDFKALHNSYRNDLIRSAAADALRRLNFYTTNLTEHSDGLKTYLDPTTRSSLPESVLLEIQIDYETGLSYRLKDPTEVTRDVYYGKHVPGLIRMDIEWIRKIKKLLNNLSTSISQPDSNLNRLTIARLFDAVLRDIPLTTSPEVAKEFEAWKKKVQPLLWYLWDKTLKRNNLVQEHFASRQFFSMLDMDVDEKVITIRPFLLTDTKTTLFVFDSRYPVPILHSVYDRLVETEFKPQPEKAQQALAKWQNEVIAGKPVEARESLKSALAQDPDVIVRELINRYQKPFVAASAFESDAINVRQKTFPLLAHNTAVRLWSHNAALSAYDLLQRALTQIQNEPLDSRLHNLADIPLTLAWLKALNYFGRDIPAQLKRLRHSFSGNETEKEIQHYLHLAAQLDSNHLTRCLDKKDLLFTKTLKELRSFSYLTPSEQSMLNILRALAFVQAAQDVCLGVEELDLTGESPRSIYAKIAPAAGLIWSNLFIQDVSDQLNDLINMLLGFEVI